MVEMQLVKTVTEGGVIATRALLNPNQLPPTQVAGSQGRAILLGELGLAKLARTLVANGFAAVDASLASNRNERVFDEEEIARVVKLLNTEQDLDRLLAGLSEDRLLALSFVHGTGHKERIRVTRDGALSTHESHSELPGLIVHSVNDSGIT